MIRTRRSFLMLAAALAPNAQAESKVRGFERRIFDRINELRDHHGAPQLEWLDAIWAEASEQSARKAILKFAGHVDPERGDIADRLNARGLPWSRCGENLFSERGYDDPVNLAIVSWWYSIGHRENLLNPAYTQSAVGIAIGPDHRIYATQIFVTPLEKGPARNQQRADVWQRRRWIFR